MDFRQSPPTLGNQYDSDALLQEYIERKLTPELRARLEPEYRALGELNGGELYQLSLADLDNEPVHTQWDAWGNRIDHVEVTDVWKRAQVICAEHGLVAAGYDEALGPFGTFLNGSGARCGRIRDSQRSFLFQNDADDIGSAALVPLGEGAEIGFLAVGSVDSDHFHPGMSLDFLTRLGELVTGSLKRF